MFFSFVIIFLALVCCVLHNDILWSSVKKKVFQIFVFPPWSDVSNNTLARTDLKYIAGETSPQHPFKLLHLSPAYPVVSRSLLSALRLLLHFRDGYWSAYKSSLLALPFHVPTSHRWATPRMKTRCVVILTPPLPALHVAQRSWLTYYIRATQTALKGTWKFLAAPHFLLCSTQIQSILEVFAFCLWENIFLWFDRSILKSLNEIRRALHVSTSSELLIQGLCSCPSVHPE